MQLFQLDARGIQFLAEELMPTLPASSIYLIDFLALRSHCVSFRHPATALLPPLPPVPAESTQGGVHVPEQLGPFRSSPSKGAQELPKARHLARHPSPCSW